MIKHIGRHNDKKVVVLYRTVPNETKNCLLVYSELLPRLYHDPLMKLLESDVGQQAVEFADAMFRTLLPDGRNMLEVLHKEGLIRKVPTSQVIITPDTNNSCRLDELNDILAKIGAGEGDKLADEDSRSGLGDPAKAQKETVRVTSADVMGETGDPSVPPPVLSEAEILAAVAKEALPVVEGEAPQVPAEAPTKVQTQQEIMRELKQGIAHVKKLEQQLRRFRV